MRGPLFGDVRVRTRIRGDGRSTTWEAWNTQTGERVLLRSFPESPTPLPAPIVTSGEGGPHARTPPFVCTLADLDPGRFGGGENTTLWSANLLLSVLRGLMPIHAAGQTHGWIGPDSVVADREGWWLAWLGPVDTPSDDLRALARLLPVQDSVTELVAGFAEDPPPSVADAARMIVSACADALASEHHALVRRARAIGRHHARSRLSALVVRLGNFSPPIGRGLLSVGEGALEVVSEAGCVRAARGSRKGPFDQGFEVVGKGGLDPVATRAVLRVHAAAPNPALAPLARWLAAAVQLRTDRMILQREAPE